MQTEQGSYELKMALKHRPATPLLRILAYDHPEECGEALDDVIAKRDTVLVGSVVWEELLAWEMAKAEIRALRTAGGDG